MDSEEGAELGIQNVAMEDIMLNDEKEKGEEKDKSLEAEKVDEEKKNDKSDKEEDESENLKNGDDEGKDNAEADQQTANGDCVNVVESTAF